MVNPYQPPSAEPYGGPAPAVYETPPAVTWFKVYAGVLAGLSIMIMLMGIAFMVMGPELTDIAEEEPELPLVVMGGVYAAAGFISAVLNLVPFFIGNKSWAWVFNLVIICLGATSCCTMVFAIPLIIYWLKPDVQAYYGRGG